MKYTIPNKTFDKVFELLIQRAKNIDSEVEKDNHLLLMFLYLDDDEGGIDQIVCISPMPSRKHIDKITSELTVKMFKNIPRMPDFICMLQPIEYVRRDQVGDEQLSLERIKEMASFGYQIVVLDPNIAYARTQLCDKDYKRAEDGTAEFPMFDFEQSLRAPQAHFLISLYLKALVQSVALIGTPRPEIGEMDTPQGYESIFDAETGDVEITKEFPPLPDEDDEIEFSDN